MDKISLFITIIIFFIISIFSLTYYFLVGRLKKCASYFIYNCYRCHESYIYLTAKNLMRNFIRGAIFYYLNDCYIYMLLCLGIVEIIVIIIAVIIQLRSYTFISKIIFSLEVINHLTFSIFNLALYFEYFCE